MLIKNALKPFQFHYCGVVSLATNLLHWNDLVSKCLPVLIPCLEFTIEIQSNSLMYKPNNEIRDRVSPVKIGKFSVKYYTY